MSDTRRIKFLSRDLPFPTDPTFREYLVAEELTGGKATPAQLMTGTAGAYAYPALAIIALMRADPNVTHDQLQKIMDLTIGDIEIEGKREEEDPPDAAGVAVPAPAEVLSPTGTRSTDETPGKNGTQVSPTTSPEPPESPTT